MISMQRFIAVLSNGVQQEAFTRSWLTESTPDHPRTAVTFTFDGRRVSAVVNPDMSAPWTSASFHHAFSGAIRRVDSSCNVRWI